MSDEKKIKELEERVKELEEENEYLTKQNQKWGARSLGLPDPDSVPPGWTSEKGDPNPSKLLTSLENKPCGFCSGTGTFNGDDCPVCGVVAGEGTVRLPVEYRQCAQCGGTGRRRPPEEGASLQCENCGGSGWTL